ncbi:uncharacterized protein MELLADRAFT_112504 [Melampsora larici-populina 98AG31]|uniref:Uncharacterized protein n=1 Tax=Melampsora larici-populina (strain 98AG31 / pathotype 3-4-7) TaxID=747676 RepID=F4S6P4_MELLP|nr:uncharacterized protein MELLADRAFT_112504 [Melampsora larici-populina 98AG31]EGF99682.1 hypothetical protein MELLADRAFT_112504 [Melampsora larici-populina 98AG31]
MYPKTQAEFLILVVDSVSGFGGILMCVFLAEGDKPSVIEQKRKDTDLAVIKEKLTTLEWMNKVLLTALDSKVPEYCRSNAGCEHDTAGVKATDERSFTQSSQQSRHGLLKITPFKPASAIQYADDCV